MEVIKTVRELPENRFNQEIFGADISQDEFNVIAALICNEDDDVQIIVPGDASNDEIKAQLLACAKAYNRMLGGVRKLKPVIGRFLSLIRNRPDLIQELGCKSFTHFMGHWVPRNLRIVESDAWNSFALVTDFPAITVADYEQVRPGKLKLITRAVPRDRGEVTPAVRRLREELVEKAKTLNYDQLADEIQNRGLRDKESLIPGTIEIKCSKFLEGQWKEFLNDFRIKAYFGTNHPIPSKVMEAMIGECTAAWYGAIDVARNL